MRRGHILHLSRGVRCGTTWSDPVLASVAAMTALIRPRGPLPARTYWVRRILILGTALALVVALGNLLTGGSDGSAGPDRAVQAAAGTTASPPPGVSGDHVDQPAGEAPPRRTRCPGSPTPTGRAGRGHPGAADRQGGRCRQPGHDPAEARPPVEPRLLLARLRRRPSTLKITSGDDAIWSSRECPRSVPSRDLVLRQAKPVWVGVTWSAQRSDEDGCTVLGHGRSRASTTSLPPPWPESRRTCSSSSPESATRPPPHPRKGPGRAPSRAGRSRPPPRRPRTRPRAPSSRLTASLQT